MTEVGLRDLREALAHLYIYYLMSMRSGNRGMFLNDHQILGDLPKNLAGYSPHDIACKVLEGAVGRMRGAERVVGLLIVDRIRTNPKRDITPMALSNLGDN